MIVRLIMLINITCSARLLRYLATHHVYKELSPDVFTNTRISSILDTGKSVNAIISKNVFQHDTLLSMHNLVQSR